MFFSSRLLVWLVCIHSGWSLPKLHNTTDSSTSTDDADQSTANNGLDIEMATVILRNSMMMTPDEDVDFLITPPDNLLLRGRDTKSSKVAYSNPTDEMEVPRLRHRLREDISNRLGTRGILFGRNKERSMMNPFIQRRRSLSMFEPFYREPAWFGYGARYPARYGRFRPFGQYAQPNQFNQNYAPYTQRLGGGGGGGGGAYPMYDQQSFAQNPSPYYPFATPYTPTQPAQSPYYQPTQSYYGGRPTAELQQPQPFPMTAPDFDDQRMVQSSVSPQYPPSSYYTNRPTPRPENRAEPVESQLQRIGSSARPQSISSPYYTERPTPRPQTLDEPMESQLQRVGSNTRPESISSSYYNARPTPRRDTREEPTESQLQRLGSSARPQPLSSPYYNDRPTPRRDTREEPMESQLQRAGSNAMPPQSIPSSYYTDRPASRREDRNEPNQPQQPSSAPGSDAQLRTSTQAASNQRDGAESQTQENRDQFSIARPLSGLASYFRAPSGSATESNNVQPQSVATSPSSQQTRELSASSTQVEPQAAAAA